MVQFLKCESTSCHEEGAEEKQESLIEILNKKFSERHCDYHPSHTWKIGVDLTKDCKFKFHHSYDKISGIEPSCGFRERLIENEVNPFVSER